MPHYRDQIDTFPICPRKWRRPTSERFNGNRNLTSSLRTTEWTNERTKKKNARQCVLRLRPNKKGEIKFNFNMITFHMASRTHTHTLLAIVFVYNKKHMPLNRYVYIEFHICGPHRKFVFNTTIKCVCIRPEFPLHRVFINNERKRKATTKMKFEHTHFLRWMEKKIKMCYSFWTKKKEYTFIKS